MARTRPGVIVIAVAVLSLTGCAGQGPDGERPAPPAHGPHIPPPPPVAPPLPPAPVPAPPVGAPYPDVTYENPGVNAPLDPIFDGRSTFSLDVDTGAYAVARRYLSDGFLPDPDSVRVEEFVNAFDGGYAAPVEDTFAISADAAPAPFGWGESSQLLRIGIRARDVADAQRPDARLTFVVDTSGSMDMENRLGLVKQSLGLLVDGLRPTDTVGIVEYGNEAEVVLPATPASEAWAIHDAIDRLRPSGSTNAAAGLLLGYELARHAYDPGSLNRVVLASDGVANVGLTDADDMIAVIGDAATEHIQLVTVGFGMGNYNDALMEQLADHGDGFYGYVDDLDEARRLFLEDLTGTLTTVALDAKAQVSFDPLAVRTYRLLGYENRAIADEQFRDDTLPAAGIGAGHSVTALYELELMPGARGPIGSVALHWTDPATHAPHETGRAISTDDFAPTFAHASPRFRLASLVAAWAGALRHDPWAAGVSLQQIADEVRVLYGELEADPDVAELVQLTAEAARLGGR
ncbi:MAG TPA: von Willebrand factor type A domain-containing protein [Candidatus Limnocylindria bacterium]